MDYKILASTYAKIEATSKRLEMTDLLVDLLKKTPPDLLSEIVYLTQGKLYPDFRGIEIGLAEKLASKAIVQATGLNEEALAKDLRKTGDLGQSTFDVMQAKGYRPKGKLQTREVYETLDKIAKTSGVGTVATKLNLLSSLIKKSTPQEAKYLIRTVTGKLRLGIADMTILDALAIGYGGGKEGRKVLERAYNISSDLGAVAEAVTKRGLKAALKFQVSVGKPIRPMLAERLSSPEEILEKMGGRSACEYKYDGERVQVHKDGNKVSLFSRRLENITYQYPDVVEVIKKNVKAKRAIIEAECVAIDLKTGDLRPFQELMHRRRKYGIAEAMAEYPVSLFVFDALYVEGKDLTKVPYPERRSYLEKITHPSERIQLGQYIIVSDPEDLEKYFEESISEGLEGVICKSVSSEAIYQAGARGWMWIKYKRDYKSEMTDTVDLVVVGAFYGRGRRKATYGALLLSTYDDEADRFTTITKCGSGFTDKDLSELPKKLKPYLISHKHPRVELKKELKPDVWFTPSLVLEIIGAEITLSPIHTSAWGKIRKEAGLAIRFPRFTGNYRLDKGPEEATTEREIIEMYKAKLHKIKK